MSVAVTLLITGLRFIAAYWMGSNVSPRPSESCPVSLIRLPLAAFACQARSETRPDGPDRDRSIPAGDEPLVGA